MNGVPPDSTVTFTGDAWRNLSFLKLDVQSGTDVLEGQELFLDNFVLRVNSIPEPSAYAFLAAGFVVFAAGQRRSIC